MKIAVVDVQYQDDVAFAALVAADDWTAAVASHTHIARYAGCAEYEPGQFYKRELPPLLSVISLAGSGIEALVVDSYVWLDNIGTPGLGARLFNELGGIIPVIGIAKTAYRGSSFALPVHRGISKRPLYVTAAGLDENEAVMLVANMHGDARIPYLVRLADNLARNGAKGLL